MELTEKIILAHKGYFNKNSEKIYRNNSKELCAVTVQKDYIKIIELDVRKSRDGILYCYHGSPWEYFVAIHIPHDFLYLKDKYNVDTLEEILGVIPEDKSVLLDIKNSNITKEDILKAISGKKFKEVIIGDTHVSSLRRFDGLPSGFVKMLFGDILSNFYNLEHLRQQNFKYLDVVFPLQINRKMIEKAQRGGISLGCSPVFFWSKNSFWEKINKYGLNRAQSDFI